MMSKCEYLNQTLKVLKHQEIQGTEDLYVMLGPARVTKNEDIKCKD